MDSTRERAEAISAELAPLPVVAAAWIFGSVARGDAGPESDLDVAILPSRELSTSEREELRSVAGRLERWSPSGRVDLLILGAQGPVLRHRVLSEGELVHDADPVTRVDFEGRTYSEYFDWKPTHDIAMRSSLRGIRDRLEREAG